jgi:hypothetical protein
LESVIDCAVRELKLRRIGVVDSRLEMGDSRCAFEQWMTRNHVSINRPYIEKLSTVFQPLRSITRKAFGGCGPTSNCGRTALKHDEPLLPASLPKL